MAALFYAINKDDTFEKFDEMKFAIKANPEFIILMTSKGMSITKFPERIVETEHFNICFYDNKGNELQLEYKNGWKIYEIYDPTGYGCVLSLKIRDSDGKVKVFGDFPLADFNRGFFNDVEDLVQLKRFFDCLKNYTNWDDLLKKIKVNRADQPEIIRKVFEYISSV